MQGDIKTEDGQRHIILMSALQMDFLSSAKTWFVDGTFKVAREPFAQLLGIHSFIMAEDSAEPGEPGEVMKQVSLCQVFMSRRKRSDYKAVFQAILNVLPTQPQVKEVVLDFERAVWSALKTCLPQARVHGCAFHWAQAVYRKVSI